MAASLAPVRFGWAVSLSSNGGNTTPPFTLVPPTGLTGREPNKIGRDQGQKIFSFELWLGTPACLIRETPMPAARSVPHLQD